MSRLFHIPKESGLEVWITCDAADEMDTAVADSLGSCHPMAVLDDHLNVRECRWYVRMHVCICACLCVLICVNTHAWTLTNN